MIMMIMMMMMMMMLTVIKKVMMMLLRMIRKRMMSLLPALPVSVSCWLTNGRVMLLGTPAPPHDADEDYDDHNYDAYK